MTTYTLEQMKEHRRLWVKALRSRKYKRAQDALRMDGGYCCLGIACLVAGKTDADLGNAVNLEPFEDVMEFFGLVDIEGRYRPDEESPTSLAKHNDFGMPFRAIADIIESEPDGLFTESVQP